MFTIAPERPDSPEVIALIAELDAYLATLYPPENNYLLSVEDLLLPEVIFLVARREGRAVGCGALRLAPGYGEIKRMYVSPSQRGSGLGRRLLEQLCAAARERGLPLVRLETGVDQPEALGLYERAGFQRTGAFGSYPADPLSLFYEKSV